MKRSAMRNSKLMCAALALAAVPGLALYLLARSSLFAKWVKLVGTPTMLALAIVLLALLLGAAIFTLVYGFDHDEPPRRRRRSRRSARSAGPSRSAPDDPRLDQPTPAP